MAAPFQDDAPAGKSGEAGNESDRCWTSTRESIVCRSEPDEHGVMSNKCERTRQVLRHCAGRPDEVVESTREVTDGKPLEALDGSFMRPLLGEGAAKAMPELFNGMSDMLRVAEKMQRAVQELMPELEEAMPRLGTGRGVFGGALPRGDSERGDARSGGGGERKKAPPPPGSSRYDEV